MNDTTASIAGSRTDGRPLLRPALKLDAVVTGANGAAYLVAAGPLGDLLGLSPTLLRAAGAFLLLFAAAVWFTGSRREIPRAAVVAIVALNVVWAVESLVEAVAGWGSPTVVGTIWIVVQAVTVAGFAGLQALGLRREQPRA